MFDLSGTGGGFLGYIGDTIYDIFTDVRDAPETFKEFLGEFFEDLYEDITSIPSAIAELFVDILVPDTEYISNKFNEFVEMLQFKFGFDTSVFANLFTSESPVEDVYVNYSIPGIGQFNLKVLDASFLTQGVSYFRPIIRGFLVLLMFLFHVKQLISFFGYDAGVITGRSEHIAEAKKAQKE